MLLALYVIEGLCHLFTIGSWFYEQVREEPKNWGIGLMVLAVALAWFVPWYASVPIVAVGALLTVFEDQIQA